MPHLLGMGEYETNELIYYQKKQAKPVILRDLKHWGVPERIINAWSQRQGDNLLPVQSKAVRKGLLGTGNLNHRDQQPVKILVSAPTSSGKSFCAEMAMTQALARRQKTIMLFPLKSLAEQKYRSLKETYEPLGIKCLIATGDHPENDKDFALGNYQVAVAIYEKFDLLLTANLDILGTIGLVVVDEIQSIAEPGRGVILERMLTKILASVYEPSFVGLSAVIGDASCAAGRLADWLGATLVEETIRPVDLHRGIATQGSYRYRTYNEGLDGDEPFETMTAGEEPFECFVNQIKNETGSTLVFLKSRRETVDYAFRLASSVNWPSAKEAVEKLQEEETSFLIRTLCQALSRGVAFHNSDLSPRQRNVIEKAFVNNEIKVIFSTSTLAMGVDLPADTVFLETVKYVPGAYDNKPVLMPVSRSEFDNITGRAGRLGYANGKPGRAIVLAQSEFDRDILWENYISPDDSEPIKSAFLDCHIDDWVLNMVATGLASDTDELARLLKSTLYSLTSDSRDDFPLLEEAVIRLGKSELLEIVEGRIAISSIGQAVAQAGLTVPQAVYFINALKGQHPQTSTGWIAMAMGAPDWNLPPGILTRYERSQNGPMKMLYRQYDHLIEEARFLVDCNKHREPLKANVAGRLKSMMVLYEWINMRPVQELEEQFQIHLGQIMSLGDKAAHFVASLSHLLTAVDRDHPAKEELKELSFCLRHGLSFSLEQLYQSFGDILVRSDFIALHASGVKTIGDLYDYSPEQLSQIIKGRGKLICFNEKLNTFKEEVDMQPQVHQNTNNTQAMPALTSKPESIVIDGSYERERYLVRINGFPVRLTGKSFKYFVKLAWSRMNRDTGWVYKEDIEMGFNQARYLYRMKNEIAAGISLDWPVFENNRLGYYRLKVEPAQISINMDNLKNHPDFELSCMFSGQGSEPIN